LHAFPVLTLPRVPTVFKRLFDATLDEIFGLCSCMNRVLQLGAVSISVGPAGQVVVFEEDAALRGGHVVFDFVFDFVYVYVPPVFQGFLPLQLIVVSIDLGFSITFIAVFE